MCIIYTVPHIHTQHPHTHLGFLSTRKREVSIAGLISPAPSRAVVTDDGVGIPTTVKTRVEVQSDVLRVMTDVDGKPGAECEKDRAKW